MSSSLDLLAQLPARVVELEICQFLDAASLARLSCASRELHTEINRSQHWATHVSRSFGLAATKVSTLGRAKRPSAHALHLQQPGISWRDVFLAAWTDSLALASAMRDNDIVTLYHRHPRVLLSQSEAKIRDELVLIQGLQRFPSSASLLRLYAQAIRQDLVVSMVR